MGAATRQAQATDVSPLHLEFNVVRCALHVRLCAARLVSGLLLRRALRLGPCRCARASGPGFGCCVAAAAAVSSRLGVSGDAACCLVRAGLFAMGQIGTQALPGPWFERCTQEPRLITIIGSDVNTTVRVFSQAKMLIHKNLILKSDLTSKNNFIRLHVCILEV